VAGAEQVAVGLGEFALGEDAVLQETEAFELLDEEEAFLAGIRFSAEDFFFPRKSSGASPWSRICS